MNISKCRKLITVLLVAVFVSSVSAIGFSFLGCGAGRLSGFARGDGKIGGTAYEIETAEQLVRLATIVNENYLGDYCRDTYFKLANDIDLSNYSSNYNSGKGWVPIGNFRNPFLGIFDGNGKVITNLYINSEDYYVGLFGVMGGGTVKNLGIESGYVKGHSYVGGIAGYGGKIENCFNKSVISATNTFVGGIVGYGYTIKNCYNTGEISSADIYVGGVAGWNNDLVENCYNTGNVFGYSDIGGIVGHGSYTIDCYNTGKISGSINVGGIVGYGDGSLANCYNTGEIFGDIRVGGISGNYANYFLEYCYNAGPVAGTSSVGGITGKGSYTNSFYDKKFTLNGSSSPLSTFGGLATAQMTDDGVLFGNMINLQNDDAWVKRSNENGLYYPELAVFKNSTNPIIASYSKLSVTVV